MRILLLSIAVFFSLASSGQQTIIHTENDNYVYCQWPNIITILNSEHPCKSIRLTTDNGEIQTLSECKFSWKPNMPSGGTIKMFALSGKDSIFLGSKTYSAIEMKFIFHLWSAKNGKVNLDTLLHLNKPFVIRDYLGHINEDRPVLEEFLVLAIRNNEELFNIRNIGDTFTMETKEKFKLLRQDDLLVFYNISYVHTNGRKKLEPVEYWIEK